MPKSNAQESPQSLSSLEPISFHQQWQKKQCLFLPFLLSCVLFLCIGNQVQCFEHNKVRFPLQTSQWGELKHVSKCLPQKSRGEKGVTILEMKHKDYCSGVIRNWDETFQNRLVSDDRRVQSLQLHIKSEIFGKIDVMSDAQVPLTSGIKLQSLNYVVLLELGGRNLTVIMDTGSDLTWVQCEPCVSCYDQQEPLFNPGVSHSYQSVLCNSTTCLSLQFATGSPGQCGTNPPKCNYMVRYGDGSYTQGELARENLTLGTIMVKDFVFGCGRNNKGLFGGVSGLMGLGKSELSLLSQTSTTFGGIFSYCLPTTAANASGSLILGEDFSVYKNTTPIIYTNLVSNPQLSTFYFLNLTGMSIGGVALQAPGFAKGQILIDSGTVISRLAPSVYRALRTEFLKQFSAYPKAPAFSILDTCFNLTGYEEVEIPTLEFWFEDSVNMTVDVTGMLYFVKSDASQVCLALASLSYKDETGIFGNYQQRNLRIVYNTKESKLGIAKEICGYT